MKKTILIIVACILATFTGYAQYNVTYRNQYGQTIGSSTTSRNYGGGYSTTYRDQYGRSTGSSTTTSNYGGGYSTTYRDQYGRSTGSSTTSSMARHSKVSTLSATPTKTSRSRTTRSTTPALMASSSKLTR